MVRGALSGLAPRSRLSSGNVCDAHARGGSEPNGGKCRREFTAQGEQE